MYVRTVKSSLYGTFNTAYSDVTQNSNLYKKMKLLGKTQRQKNKMAHQK